MILHSWKENSVSSLLGTASVDTVKAASGELCWMAGGNPLFRAALDGALGCTGSLLVGEIPEWRLAPRRILIAPN